MKWSNIKDYINNTISFEPNTNVFEEDVNEQEEITWSENVDDRSKYELMNINSFIGVKSHVTSNEQFNLYRVEEKRVAAERIADSSGEHWILSGEPYLVCRWFSFQNEGRKYAQYACAKSTELASIHIGEVFMTGIDVDDKYRLEIGTYRMLVCSL